MAALSDGGVELGTAATADFAAHERTYRGFLALLKWSCIGIVVILVLMAIFLL
jgi:uncharacterized membrane protein YjfL (UPF0719 family)